VSELISGRTRDRISLYTSSGVPIGPEKCCEEAHRVAELGLAGYKVQAGSGPDRELEVVREVRSVLPSQTSLMVDGNAWCLGEHKYTHPEIHQFGSGDV
jgi:L-alanine-DL-glutamate epimerase-like enolase superfamily enzyme